VRAAQARLWCNDNSHRWDTHSSRPQPDELTRGAGKTPDRASSLLGLLGRPLWGPRESALTKMEVSLREKAPPRLMAASGAARSPDSPSVHLLTRLRSLDADWEARVRSLNALQVSSRCTPRFSTLSRTMLRSQAQYEHLGSSASAQQLRRLEPVFTKQISDLRSAVVKAACDCLVAIARATAPNSRSLVSSILPFLFERTGSGNRVITSHIRSCLDELGPAAPLSALVQRVAASVRHKNPVVREAAVRYLRSHLACASASTISRERSELLTLTRVALDDASETTRAIARGCFWLWVLQCPKDAEAGAAWTSLPSKVRSHLDEDPLASAVSVADARAILGVEAADPVSPPPERDSPDRGEAPPPVEPVPKSPKRPKRHGDSPKKPKPSVSTAQDSVAVPTIRGGGGGLALPSITPPRPESVTPKPVLPDARLIVPALPPPPPTSEPESAAGHFAVTDDVSEVHLHREPLAAKPSEIEPTTKSFQELLRTSVAHISAKGPWSLSKALEQCILEHRLHVTELVAGLEHEIQSLQSLESLVEDGSATLTDLEHHLVLGAEAAAARAVISQGRTVRARAWSQVMAESKGALIPEEDEALPLEEQELSPTTRQALADELITERNGEGPDDPGSPAAGSSIASAEFLLSHD
jgi:hypothetical protein